MTTKFEIDIADAAGCESSLRTIFKAMDRLHGTRKTGLIVRDAFAPEPGSPQALAALEFRKVRRGLKPEDLGLLLAYYEMPRPSKRGLAKKLAQINKKHAPDGPFGPTGSDNPDVMLRQIKRVFSKHSDRLAAIEALDPELRREEITGTMVGTAARRQRRIAMRSSNVIHLKPKRKLLKK
jgi:hypothetical protein